MVLGSLMYIDDCKFDAEKQIGMPLVLKPRGDFDLNTFLEEKHGALIRFCDFEPFFVIEGAGFEDGVVRPNIDDHTSTYFHYDGGGVIVLANNYSDNDRGWTEWVSDAVLIPAVLSQMPQLQALGGNAFADPELLPAFKDLVKKCQSCSREAISRLLGMLYCSAQKTPEIEHIICGIAMRTNAHIQACDWKLHPQSSLCLNNQKGFHRGVYNRGKGMPLRRKFL